MNGATSLTPPPNNGSRYPPDKFSSTPMINPPTIAAWMLSKPPRIVTGTTFKPKKASEPSTPPRMLPSSTPPIAETIAAMLHDKAKIRFTEIPIDSATCCENAVARIAMPSREYRKKVEKRISSSATDPKLHRYPWDTGTGPNITGVDGNRAGKGRVSVPHSPLTPPRRMLDRPKVTMITEITGSPAIGAKVE